MSEAWLHDDRLKSAMLLVLAIFLAKHSVTLHVSGNSTCDDLPY
jgi:hypothetical protein